MAYVNITLKQMQKELSSFLLQEDGRSGEYIFVNEFPTYTVKVFSSIRKYDDNAREVGEDSIKILLIDTPSQKVIAKRRVYRVKNWKTNLSRAIGELVFMASTIKRCKMCNAMMVERKGKYGKFWGCSRFPACTYTEKIEKEVSHAS